MRMYSILLNPTSGGGTALKVLDKIEALLKERHIEYRVDQTRKAGDATRLSAQAAQDGLEGVIALGGDGTFFEVVNGIAESGLELIFAPCGTGNDFMRMFDLPKDTVEAVRKQLDSPRWQIDMGKCNERYFLNVAGAGFDVDVLIQTEKYKAKHSGLNAYLRGAYNAIRNYHPLQTTVSVDGGAETPMPATILSVGNGRFIGGGMKAVPDAVPDDGYFDVVIAKPVSKLSIYALLLLFVAGKHANRKSLCRKIRCKSIHIRCEGMVIEADGEMFPCEDALIQVLPGALRTRLPK